MGEARKLVREVLRGADRDDLVETGTLLVSEVVTNAMLHAGTAIDVSAWVDDDGLRVEVSDGSQHLPTRRRYAATSGTGRGLLMLERMVDDWGVSRHGRGKTVWFQLASPAPRWERLELQEDEDPRPRRTWPETTTVVLLDLPLLLLAAWREHAEALLREYLLASLDHDSEIDPIQVHADATDAIAILEEQIPHADVSTEPGELLADSTEPWVTMRQVTLEVPVDSVPHFQTLGDAIEASYEMWRLGRILTPPTQPEVRAFRRWLCREVLEQAAGRRPVPWSMTVADEPDTPPWPWDLGDIRGAGTPLIAADETNRIVAVSPAALEILGYTEHEQIEGRRLVSLIPERFRQAHIAGFTLHLLVGRQPLLGRAVEVPALCADGSEVTIELLLTTDRREGRTLFLADIRRV